MATRPVLRIFISSTAVDLLDFRVKVRDAVLRLEHLPIAMETFSAMPGQPVSECTRMAAEADAVICVVAHRYGYVPPVELGGDGERSITWLEVAAAKRVFAFVVDPAAPWTTLKEQDRLVSEPPEKVPEIAKAVQKLKEFKEYLGKGRTLTTFSSPEDLGEKVGAALANFTPGAGPVSTTRIWQPLFCHALQPAQHFRGRFARLQELKDWFASPVTPDRVISLVAAGGTGKTALVDQAIHEANLSNRSGVFVWSFYEDPDTDKFLRAAYMYFTGETGAPAGGMLERLQLALSGDAPHILVLDGLERVQSEADHRRRGELEDLQLKRLVRALAGGVGAARALVTSRFPMIDLDGFTGAGHRAIQLDDLEPAVALEVLRAWKVTGDDATLTRLVEPLGNHALSVAVLGSYIGNFEGGDPSKAFSLEEARETDTKADKLLRILNQYAKALTNVERDLLARMALFPRGVYVECLGWIAQAGGDVSGALIGLSDHQLVSHLERLKKLGLVFGYRTNEQVIYSAHPFLRTFFRDLLAAKPESVHESVRAKLAPSLEARPSTKPSDPAILDQYELLIEESLLAGRVQDAFDLYWYGLGGYRNFGWVLGANARGLRILERFIPGDDFSALQNQLPARNQSALTNDLGLFATDTGDLARARRAFRHCAELGRAASDRTNESVSARNLCEVELRAACFPPALNHAEGDLALATQAQRDDYRKTSFAYRATAHHSLGNIQASEEDFRRATELEGKPLFSIRGIQEAESKARSGDLAGALAQTEANREIAVTGGWHQDVCLCDALLARLLLPDAPDRAAQHLRDARAFAERSGAVDLQLRCFQAACELQLHLRDYPQAIAEGEAGILLADTCGHGKYSIEIRIALAETYLASGDPRKALRHARWALDRSEQPDCQYAWGRADGLHFCGLAHLRLGETELARQRLTAALELRENLGHGRREETREALQKLSK